MGQPQTSIVPTNPQGTEPLGSICWKKNLRGLSPRIFQVEGTLLDLFSFFCVPQFWSFSIHIHHSEDFLGGMPMSYFLSQYTVHIYTDMYKYMYCMYMQYVHIYIYIYIIYAKKKHDSFFATLDQNLQVRSNHPNFCWALHLPTGLPPIFLLVGSFMGMTIAACSQVISTLGIIYYVHSMYIHIQTQMLRL